MGKQFEMELKVGAFVAIGLGLIMAAILMLGGVESLFTRKNTYVTHMKSVEGLITGAKVVLSGIQVGSITDITIDGATNDVRVAMEVNRKYDEWIRTDSAAEIRTQGVLGDKFIALTSGSPDLPKLADGAEITNRPTKDLTQTIGRADQLMVSLNSIANSLDRMLKSLESQSRNENIVENLGTTTRNLAKISEKLNGELDQLQIKRSVKSLNSILEKIDNGSGTLGALINDPGLYDDAKALVGGANRNRIIRNIVRKTIKDSESETAAPNAGGAPETAPKK